MSGNESVGARIMAAQARHCTNIATELAAARSAGAPPDELAELEAQELAARNRLQELAVDMPGQSHGIFSKARRPWWRIW